MNPQSGNTGGNLPPRGVSTAAAATPDDSRPDPLRNALMRVDDRSDGYDKPFNFSKSLFYNILLNACDLLSMSCVVFLRRKIGYRPLQLWRVLVCFVVMLVLFAMLDLFHLFGLLPTAILYEVAKRIATLMSLGLLYPVLSLFEQPPFLVFSCWAMALFAFVSFGLSLFRGQVAFELIDHPEALRDPHCYPLHTRVRGDSFLAEPLERWNASGRWTVRFQFPRFSDWERRSVHLFPPKTEQGLQYRWEPTLLLVVALLSALLIGDPALTLWLLLSSLCLIFVESDMYTRSFIGWMNMRDAAIEANVAKAAHDDNFRRQHEDRRGKIGGIAVASPEMQNLRARSADRSTAPTVLQPPSLSMPSPPSHATAIPDEEAEQEAYDRSFKRRRRQQAEQENHEK